MAFEDEVIKITRVEMVQEPGAYPSGQMILKMLKERGAPIIGTLWLRIDWSRCLKYRWWCNEKGMFFYKFRTKKEATK